MDNVNSCILCNRKLTTYEIRNKNNKCINCRCEIQIKKNLSNEYLANIFNYTWTQYLIIKYYDFLLKSKINLETVKRHLKKAEKLFIIAEKDFLNKSDISIEWIESTITTEFTKYEFKLSLISFLKEEGILDTDNNEKTVINAIDNILDKIPQKFRRHVKLYYLDRMEKRKRQIHNRASKPLKLSTIRSDVEEHYRLINFIANKYINVSSWDLVQEEHINEFLLTFNPNNREFIRKSLYAFFRFLKTKRLIFKIPMLNIPARELPSINEPLDINSQKKVAISILNNVYENPLQSLLTSLCFYHGLSSEQIRNIKLKDIDVAKRLIEVKKRAPVFLSNEEIISLQEYIKIRNENSNAIQKDYLVISQSNNNKYSNNSVPKAFLSRLVKSLTGHTPKLLRFTCFSVLASRHGPQILVDGFGVSLTHASRFGKLEEFLVEEELMFQRKF